MHMIRFYVASVDTLVQHKGDYLNLPLNSKVNLFNKFEY